MKIVDIELSQFVCRCIARMLNRFESLMENIGINLLKAFGRSLDILKDATKLLVVQTSENGSDVGSCFCKGNS